MVESTHRRNDGAFRRAWGWWMGSGGAAAQRLIVTAAIGGLVAFLSPRACLADTLEWALAQAYQNNPQLNAQRAAARAQDEGVPQALSGYRPRASLVASV